MLTKDTYRNKTLSRRIKICAILCLIACVVFSTGIDKSQALAVSPSTIILINDNYTVLFYRDFRYHTNHQGMTILINDVVIKPCKNLTVIESISDCQLASGQSLRRVSVNTFKERIKEGLKILTNANAHFTSKNDGTIHDMLFVHQSIQEDIMDIKARYDEKNAHFQSLQEIINTYGRHALSQDEDQQYETLREELLDIQDQATQWINYTEEVAIEIDDLIDVLLNEMLSLNAGLQHHIVSNAIAFTSDSQDHFILHLLIGYLNQAPLKLF